MLTTRICALGLFAISILPHAEALSTVGKLALGKRQECGDIESQCSGSISDCVYYICNSCTDVDPVVPTCCVLTDAVDTIGCLDEGLNLGSSATSDFTSNVVESATELTAAASTSGLGAAVTSDPNFTACSSLDSISEYCASQTPGFTDADFTSQVPCLCYDSQTYDGTIYDNYYGSCLAFISTADPEGFSSLVASPDRSLTGPCAGAANTMGAGPTTHGFKSTATAGGGGGGFVSQTPTPASSPRIGNTAPTPTTTSNTGAGGGSGSFTGGQGKASVSYSNETLGISVLTELDR